MLPDLNNCDFFKKATLFSGAKSEKAFIFKLKSDGDYTFMFTCPGCGSKNEFKEQMAIKEVKEAGKKKNYVAFKCKKCATEFMVEKFKVKQLGKKKSST
jgi:transcription elongation factor Elf1